MFSPQNISQSDCAHIVRSRKFPGLPELFESNASVDQVASLTENLLSAHESDSTQNGAPYQVQMKAIGSDYKVQVKSKIGDESDVITNPLSIKLKSFKHHLSDVFDQALTYGEVSLTPFVMGSNMDIAYIFKLPVEQLIRKEPKYTQCDLYGPINLRKTPVSLLVSVLVFQGIIDYRDKLKTYPELQDRVIRSTRLKKNVSLSSYLYTLGASERSGKGNRDIEREKISREAFNVCLRLGLDRSDDCDQEVISKLMPQIEKLKVSHSFYFSGIDDRHKPPVEAVVLDTKDFLAEEILNVENWYSINLATAFVVSPRESGAVGPQPESGITPLDASERYIMKVFDPVKLSCFTDGG